MKTYFCNQCHTEFNCKYRRVGTPKYCSQKCNGESKARKRENATKHYCVVCNNKIDTYKVRYIKKTCSKLCLASLKRQKTVWNKGLIGYKAGFNHHWFGSNKSGSNNPAWKGGERKQKEKKHLCSKYKKWAFEVKTRDFWQCKIQNQDCHGRLEAHHILPWRDYPELRYQVNNGITLCQYHHPRAHDEEKRLTPYFQELVSVSSDLH